MRKEGRSTASDVRQRVLHAHDRVFIADDFAGSRQAVQRELSRLVAAGELRRLRNGAYWRGKQTALGMTPPKAEAVVGKISGSAFGVGPASWSAALELGFSSQHPNREFVASPVRIKGDLGRIEVKDRSSREQRLLQQLNRSEVALLELLEVWEQVVEIPTDSALERLSTWLDSGSVRVGKLVKAATSEPPVVREHLRELLSATGRDADVALIRGASDPGKIKPLALTA